MKRLISLILCGTFFMTGCNVPEIKNASEQSTSTYETSQSVIEIVTEEIVVEPDFEEVQFLEFDSLSDADLLNYIEDLVYQETVLSLDNEKYFVENVEAIYISKEYIEEAAYNSQSNVYFGYTLSELDELFEGSKYVFTLGEDGTTVVQKLVEIKDTDTEQILENVAIGTGVILFCVTVSVVSVGVGATAVSMIFAASAKTGTIMALSSGAFGGISAGIIRGIETGDFNEVIEAAAIGGSEGFKWGAISGSVEGGTTMTMALKGATLNGLTMKEAAAIQKESKLPLDFIKNFHSIDEYKVFKDSGLQLKKVNNKWSLVQEIDWDFIGDLSDGRTNAQRVADGLAPLDPTGNPYELHHIGQKSDSPLAILTSSQHKGNYSTLHSNTGGSASEINRTQFKKEKIEYWDAFYKMSQGG